MTRAKILILVLAVCNQLIYDQIYVAILLNTLEKPVLNKEILSARNNAIEMLRKLCNGQRSSYEQRE